MINNDRNDRIGVIIGSLSYFNPMIQSNRVDTNDKHDYHEQPILMRIQRVIGLSIIRWSLYYE